MVWQPIQQKNCCFGQDDQTAQGHRQKSRVLAEHLLWPIAFVFCYFGLFHVFAKDLRF